MKYYTIKKYGKDYKILENVINTKGTRPKRIVIDCNNKKAIFKYEHPDYCCSEACSEKMSYEIAKVLNYPCAKIDLAQDKDGNIGILNYLFVDVDQFEHMDAIVYLKRESIERSSFYTISNIKKCLDYINETLFSSFIDIMIFDALVGEQDRHEENWGINNNKGIYQISPLYDNGCNLLREFKDKNTLDQYVSGKKDFNAYIRRSKTMIYKEDHKSRYKHFELIEYLNGQYPELMKKKLKNLCVLTDEKIEQVVNCLPEFLLTEKHKDYIIRYLKERRSILLKIGGII